MLNSSMNYPYPILRGKKTDYQTSIFTAQLSKKNLKDGYIINAIYSVSNSEIQQLIEDKKAAYALQIQCVSTWFRKLEISSSSIQEFKLSSNLIHERVDMCPCIIALEEIKDFNNSDFSEDFEGISFSVNPGEVLAIGERQKFDAIYKDDIIKKGDPIVHFINDEQASVMFCEYDFDTIRIHLPKQQNEKYNRIGTYEGWKVPVLNAIYVIPAIAMGIEEIYKDTCLGGSGTLERWSWYKTLKVMILRKAKDVENVYLKMLSDPIKTAQMLMNDNSAQALDIIAKAVKP